MFLKKFSMLPSRLLTSSLCSTANFIPKISTFESPPSSPTPLIIHQFPCLTDNYGFILHSPITKETAAIDVPHAPSYLNVLRKKNYTLTHILNTHWHADHMQGNQALREEFDNVITYGPPECKERDYQVTTIKGSPTPIEFGSTKMFVLDTPGHTLEHISYYVPSLSTAFVGDTIFSMGCGRMFEGNPTMFVESINRIKSLPDSTLLFCAHEYTKDNAEFALCVEPTNEDLATRSAEINKLREDNQPTVPTSLELEKKTNPFMRLHLQTVQEAVSSGWKNEDEIFKLLRKKKDDWNSNK